MWSGSVIGAVGVNLFTDDGYGKVAVGEQLVTERLERRDDGGAGNDGVAAVKERDTCCSGRDQADPHPTPTP